MSDNTSWRSSVGEVGEAAVRRRLESLGWSCTNLNATRRNEPNVDLVAQKGHRGTFLQVKTYNDYGWISAGGVNPKICAGAPLFNRVKSAQYQCEFVVCVTPASPGDKRIIRDDWRFFVMPVDVADRLFRINVDAYFNSPKRDGSPRVQRGACQDWVGPGPIPASTVPDHQHDYHPFENDFARLDRPSRTG